MPSLPVFQPLTAGEINYIAKLNTDFNTAGSFFAAISSLLQDAPFLDNLLPLAAALGLTLPPTTLVPLPLTPLSMGETTYIPEINNNFAQIRATFNNIVAVVGQTNPVVSLSRFLTAMLGGLPCLIGNHSYFCSKASNTIYTQTGYAWLPSIPAVVHNALPRPQFLGGGQADGEWWYMLIDAKGFPKWVLGENGDSVIQTGINSTQRIKGNGITTNAFFRAWVVAAPGEWLIFPPEQLLPIFQLAPSPPVLTTAHP